MNRPRPAPGQKRVIDRETVRLAQNERSVRLRKQRKEERLNIRRQIPGATATVTPNLSGLQRSLEALSAEYIDESLFNENVSSLLRELNTFGPDSYLLLRALIYNQPHQAQRLVERLLPCLSNASFAPNACEVLEFLASPDASPSTTSNDDYYGAASTRWADLFLPHSEGLVTLWETAQCIASAGFSRIMASLIAQNPSIWTRCVLSKDKMLWASLVRVRN
jgi:hypothetical protein